MKAKISLLYLCFLISFFAIFCANAALGQTTIEDTSGCGYQIKVAAAFYFNGKDSRAMADQLLAKWQAGIEKVWGSQNQFKTAKYNCPIRFDFDLKKVPAGQSCADFPNYHCLTVVDEAKNQRGNLADIIWTTANSKANSNGEWSMSASEMTASHEFGHLMGLKDEYHWDYQYKDIAGLSGFEKYNKAGQFWTAYDAVNLQFDSKTVHSGETALSFEINPKQSSYSYAEVGAVDLTPTDFSSYKDLYLSGWVYLPQDNIINSISLNIGTDNLGGVWGSVDEDLVFGWNYVRIKLDKMTVYGAGLNYQKINTFILRINYDESFPSLLRVAIDDFSVGNFQKVWVNDNRQVLGPQSIMAQTWGEAAVLPQSLEKIIAAQANKY